MHPVVARLLALSLGGAALCGCKESCSTPTVARSFESLGATAPDVVAAAYVASDLQTGRRSLTVAQCVKACGPSVTGCMADIAVRGNQDRPELVTGAVICPVVEETQCHTDFDPFNLDSCPFGCGRRPSGVAAARVRTTEPLLDHVARIALLEALSVGAFAQLSSDLRRHAPQFLPRIARAQQDERRHARRARTLLRALGGSPLRTPRVPRVERTLAEVALDNGIEGCVHETFGAALASIQARRAGSAPLRRFFAAIAGDEIEHAALSWDLHDALGARLRPHVRAQIATSQRRAIESIEQMPQLAERLRVTVGAPTVEERRSLLTVLRASIAGVA